MAFATSAGLLSGSGSVPTTAVKDHKFAPRRIRSLQPFGFSPSIGRAGLLPLYRMDRTQGGIIFLTFRENEILRSDLHAGELRKSIEVRVTGRP